eukprot:gene6845-20424_t
MLFGLAPPQGPVALAAPATLAGLSFLTGVVAPALTGMPCSGALAGEVVGGLCLVDDGDDGADASVGSAARSATTSRSGCPSEWPLAACGGAGAGFNVLGVDPTDGGRRHSVVTGVSGPNVVAGVFGLEAGCGAGFGDTFTGT